MNKITVLVVDDSAFMRKMITQMLSSDPEIEVIGTARDGQDALDKIDYLKPQVISLDIEMPRMDGLSMLNKLMETNPMPVVMVSSLTQKGSEATVKALELGAIDFVGKPSGTISLDIELVKNEIVEKIKIASRAKVLTPFMLAEKKLHKKTSLCGAQIVVVVGSSTGGPQAVCKLFSDIDPDTKAAFAIVQHMPPFFTKALADRLQKTSSIVIKEAEDGDRLMEGTCVVAKGGYHLDIKPDGIVRLSKAPPVKAVRPSIDVTMSSVAKIFGSNVIGVVLTGMGSDGTYGIREIKQAGGYSIAEHEQSCVVYGMSRSVIENGLADEIMPLEHIAERINKLVKRLSSVGSIA